MRPVINVDGRPRRAYRVAYELFIGAIPAGAFICHKCDTSLCVNPDHVYAGSALTNNRDAVARRRHVSFTQPELARQNGERLGRRGYLRLNRTRKSIIIPHADIPEIERRLSAGESPRAIGDTYRVSRQAVIAFMARARRRAALALTEAK